MKILTAYESGLKFGNLQKRTDTKYLVLHHADATKCTVQDVHKWHLNKGYSGIGYHFFVSKKGEIYEGRPIESVGAHCYGFNKCSIGICAEGDFTKDIMPDIQKKAINEILLYLKNIYPKAEIKGHKELTATACPAPNFPLEELKKVHKVDYIETPQDAIAILVKKGIINTPDIWYNGTWTDKDFKCLLVKFANYIK